MAFDGPSFFSQQFFYKLRKTAESKEKITSLKCQLDEFSDL